MSHTLVRILIDDDGLDVDSPQWHLLETDGGGPHALCTGEFVGEGESGCVFETNEVQRGVPCARCRAIIKRHKVIAL